MMDLYNLPIDLRHEIATHLTFSCVANWALVSRRHYECINPILYLKLPRYRPSEKRGEKPSPGSDPRFRGLVLAWAASRGRLNTIKNIVSSAGQGPWLNEPVFGYGHGGGLRTPGFYGMPPMHHAAGCGNADVIDLLVDYGADPDLTTAGDLRPIHYARNADVVRTLVRHGCSIHATNLESTPPLAYLVMSRTGNIGAIKKLLHLGSDPNDVAPWGNNAGQEAVRLGDPMILRLLLKAGLRVADISPAGRALVNTTPKQPSTGGSTVDRDPTNRRRGRSLIYEAIKHCGKLMLYAVDLVDILLKHGVPAHGGEVVVYRELTLLRTNLYLAVTLQVSSTLVRLLLENGAETEAKCWNPDLFSREGARSPLQRGASDPETPMTRALFQASVGDHTPVGRGRLNIASILLEYGANINQQFQDSTLLTKFLAEEATTDVREVVLFMLERGADVHGTHTIDQKRYQPIHLVLRSSTLFEGGSGWFKRSRRCGQTAGLDLLRSLLEHGADPNALDELGDSPLAYACRLPLEFNAGGAIKLLLKHGADINGVSSEGLAHLHTILNMLPHRSSEANNSLFYCPGSTVLEIPTRFQMMMTGAVSRNLDLEARNVEGMTALMSIAATKLHLGRDQGTFFDAFTICERMMVMLLRNGADIHATQSGNSDNSLTSGGTALHFACYNCNIAALELLLQKGASKDVNRLTQTGFTPLMVLITGGLDKAMTKAELEHMTQVLLDAGADPAINSPDGKTAFDIWITRHPTIYTGRLIRH
ncbi:ankyrin repeat-containing domain protein [Ilyonectria robusta]|uniref:ankyrin repeat-containing domain protein n=1 Tax=Ilyonectria robusta TaxID=1079257 RepID=UPI001E8CAB40|nr:ankyrin repeat-containing domain protein [Ilyonectria robusta]KAH8680322.1 ankyrin repeat-containing domain protein [Ilyonectria robusta]